MTVIEQTTVASPASTLAVVLRPLDAAGAQRSTGEVVDATGWRLLDNLVDGRFLRLLDRNDPQPLTADDGRMFVDDESFMAYIANRDEVAAAVADAEEEI